jgi:AhpD family alkylhydroperoxidase
MDAPNAANQMLRHFSSPQEFLGAFTRFAIAMGKLRKLGEIDRANPILAEKVMLAVVGVNNCECCSFNHTVIALERGISKGEIECLLSRDIGSLNDTEIPAILYAQHWADTKGKVQPATRERALAEYGEKKVVHIEALIRLSEFTSLCNNTVIFYKNTKKGKGMGLYFSYLLCLPFHAIMMRRFKQNQGQSNLKRG